MVEIWKYVRQKSRFQSLYAKTIIPNDLLKKNIAKGTTDPGVDYFNQLLWFGLVELV